jgi:hypothetical protein
VDRENEKKIWKKKISDFEASGMTIADFSRSHGFSLQQYHYWKNKIIKNQSKPATAPTPHAPQSSLIKVIPQPLPISSLPDPVWLANFIKALHEVS